MDERPDPSLKKSREKEYNAIKLRLSIADIVLNIVIIGILAFSGISPLIEKAVRDYLSNDYLVFLVFITVVGVIYSILDFPFDFYGGYVVEHRFGLSNQSVPAWLFEKIKGAAVGVVVGVPVAMVFYLFLKMTGWLWWLWFSIFMFFISVFLARIAPVVIFPIFYKFRELESEEIRERIRDLVEGQGISIRGIYSFNLSKDTKKANAGFTGIGRSKRIILSDTLIGHFSPEEIAVIFAHEMGHYKKRHIVKSIVLGTASIFLSFFLCGELYRITLAHLGFTGVHDIAAIPILFFYLTLFSLVTMPLSNALSRMYEREADRYALDATRDRDAFISSMEKLADLNLADRDPNPVTEFMFYSHPSIKKRIALARAHVL
ncbi:MAG TPA: M48 family metallopeptidase [Spirochaetota bacterium]|nr:M48 family metallopeptidase [Spirochaetota bacterium]HPC40213.1 M48 family metallopeptidase [Spirochaetota bacterium]HPL16193.1 M48 family metallopeptidase [Spirochaetota bacterium]HQF07313.1 M48 family metallopeptidase [Spirochaetota bacterium]HQH96214.1 M48 family metallopeptidase [Spirochaetota bacterium]